MSDLCDMDLGPVWLGRLAGGAATSAWQGGSES